MENTVQDSLGRKHQIHSKSAWLFKSDRNFKCIRTPDGTDKSWSCNQAGKYYFL